MKADEEVREWFEDAERQQQASQLGMWLFLTTEVLLFGALFALYLAYHVRYGQDFAQAAAHSDIAIGTTNTFILITSSFFVAWAIHMVRHAKRRAAVWCLLAAVALGGAFLVLKGVEYAHHFEHGIFPGHAYRFAELPADGAKLFFTLYFIMTGLHALHVIGGMTALAVLAWLTHRGRFRRGHDNALENGGLYWHLVDVVWIFLWPLLYLVG